MDDRALACTKCRMPLPDGVFNAGHRVTCPACGAGLEGAAFPALFRPVPATHAGETILAEGEASCFYHPRKRAALPCSACGRFLCQLCDVEIGDQHLCPACLEKEQQKGRLTQLETKRTLYDSAALSLSLLPLLAWPVTLVTAPLAVYLAIYSWGKPSSIVPRTRIRAYLAITFGGLQIAGWAVLFVALLRQIS
jgi:hypothetical protein